MVKVYEPKSYWEERLTKEFNLDAVGFNSFGKSYNRWLYRMREVNLGKVIENNDLLSVDKSVLDIGCGTGFYVDIWQRKGIKHLTGVDIANVSKNELSIQYPGYKFHEADIASNSLVEQVDSKFDVITAFDVLFHIVDDCKFEQAIKNIRSLCSDTSVILITDIFPHKRPYVLAHQKSRILEDYTNVLKRNGIEIIDRVPVHYLLNAPLDISNGVLQRLVLLLWWQLFVRIVERTTHLLGYTFSRLDLLLARFFKESPSTEMIICRPILGDSHC